MCAFQLLRGSGVALLGAVGIEPEGFDGLVQRFLVVQQVQFAGLFLNLGFLYGTLGLPVAEDGHAYGEAQRVVPVLLDLFAEGEVVAVGVRAPYACTKADGGDVTGAGDIDVEFRGFDIQPACFDFRAQGEGGAVDIGL